MLKGLNERIRNLKDDLNAKGVNVEIHGGTDANPIITLTATDDGVSCRGFGTDVEIIGLLVFGLAIQLSKVIQAEELPKKSAPKKKAAPKKSA